MRKTLLLIPVLFFSLLINAKEIEINSGTSNIIHYTIAASTTEDGDVIVLKDAGPYISTSGTDDYTKLVKNLTIKAADGVKPVIQLGVPFRSTNGKSVKFIGITFDGTSLTDYGFYFRFYDNADNLEFEDCEFKNISKYIFHVYSGKIANSLKLTNCQLHDNSSRGVLNEGTLTNLEINGCEIYNFTGDPVLDNYSGATLGKVKINGTEFYNNAKDIISGAATSHADSCIIKNCYFHNNSRSAVYFAASTVDGVETCDGVVVKNSTFANNDLSASSRSVIEVQNYGAVEVSNIEVTVDHCTFYNNATINYDYSCVRSRKSTKVSITNSIFAFPSAIDFYATNCYGGTISNTLVYNLSRGHRSSSGAPALTNNITADPLFTDAANGDFSLKGNWVTMEISPARGAATDGSDLGDPRWYSNELLPEVDFDPSFVFLGEKAMLSGSFALNGDNYIQSQDKSYAGIATWKIQAERKCVVEVTLKIASANTSGHRYEVALYDANNELVGTALAESSNSWSAGDKIMGAYEIPTAGIYTIKLTNDCANSSTIIEGVTFSYNGGAVVPVSPTINTTLNIADALFSGCTREAGYIKYPSSGTSSAWIKWNISTSATAFYDITVNINTEYAHGFTVAIYEDESAAPVASVTEGSYISTTGDGLALELGNINLVGGKNYVVKVTNAPSGSQAKVLNVTFTPAVSSATILPTTINLNDAHLSEKAHITDGALWFNTIGDSNPVGQWAEWEVEANHAGTFLFTMAVSSTNSQSYRITILDSGNNEVAVYDKNAGGSGDKTISHYFYLATGTYFVKIENTHEWSQGHILSLVVTEPDNILPLDQTATSAHETAEAQNVQIIRSFTGGMYNTICLPFGVDDSKLREVFGSDVILKKLNSAEFDATSGILDLSFENAASSGMYQGTPYLIKPSHNVVNPVFENVVISVTDAGHTNKANANFIGTFVATTIPAGENNLFLGPNDKLYFSPDAATPINGFRGWFVVHDIPGGAHAIKKARIAEQGQVVTTIDLVKDENGNVQKVFRNGQLIIIRDGIEFTVQGQRIQ